MLHPKTDNNEKSDRYPSMSLTGESLWYWGTKGLGDGMQLAAQAGADIIWSAAQLLIVYVARKLRPW